MHSSVSIRFLGAQPITPKGFEPYGQVIFASDDGAAFSAADAQLQLDSGIPRLYIMRLEHRRRQFSQITRHQRCTQCLGSLEGREWLLAVAPPGDRPTPDLNALRAFRVPGNCFIKLNVGTWHAGPYFEGDRVEFYNLELSDTNVIDHDTCDLGDRFGMAFEIVY